jgi:hypothetical protein
VAITIPLAGGGASVIRDGVQPEPGPCGAGRQRIDFHDIAAAAEEAGEAGENGVVGVVAAGVEAAPADLA